MLLLSSKHPLFKAAVSAGAVNLETGMLALLMHDLGWATTKSILSKDKRFEVDSAELSVKFIQDAIHSARTTDQEWSKARLEELWTAIALHTSPSIATHHPNPTVAIVALSIMADFFGPNLPLLVHDIITPDEYKAIVQAYPREGFKEDLIDIMCGLCREKKETTFDNFVSEFGRKRGLDGKGTGKEKFIKECDERSLFEAMMQGIDACAELEKDL